MILVIGATGTTGRYVRDYLAEEGADVVGGARHGADVRFNWFDPETWDGALAGVDRTYLIAPPGISDPVTVMRPFLDRARAGGVKRAVLQSSSLIGRGDPGLGRVHDAVADTFPQWAVLRPSWFMQNFTGRHVHGDAIREGGVLTSATGGGRVGFVDVRDIARVAVRALLDDRSLDGDPILTGPAALSYDDVAAIISRESGRTITHVDVGYDRLREIHSTAGLPDDYAALLAGLDGLIAAGAEDRTTDCVLRITGSPPRSFEALAAETRWESVTA